MQQPIESPYSASTTADEVIGSTNLKGKLAVITGGSTGIGKETARVLANAGADIFIGARSLDKLDAAKAELTSESGSQIYTAELDLLEPASVDAFADAVLALDRPIDILINNAGIMASPLERNSLGIESQLATNYVGHAILTSRLAPAMLRAGESRLVSLSSSGHQASGVIMDDVNWEHIKYNKWAAYGQSKTGNSLLAFKVAKELGDKGVTALAVHPGYIQTELGRYMPEGEWAMSMGAAAKMAGRTDGPSVKTVHQGAATSVWAATAAELNGKGPLYLENCQVAEIIDKPNMLDGVVRHAIDEDMADKLWQKAEELLGKSLPL